MIILRVAMGRGWLKETSKDINTTLVFANPPTVDEETQEIQMTIQKLESSMCGPETLAASSDTSVDEHKGKAGMEC
jgi:hypothetical protein